MNQSQAYARPTSAGYHAVYSPSWATRREEIVSDENGKPILFGSERDAELAAHKALVADLNRTEGCYIDPHPHWFFLAVRPKTRAGLKVQAKKRFAKVQKEAAE